MSLFDEHALRSLVADEVRKALRDELGHRPKGPGEYISVADAGRLASVSPQTIRAWMRDGRLTTHRAGRVLRVRRSELENLLTGARLWDRDFDRRELSPEELADRDLRHRRRGHAQRELGRSDHADTSNDE